MRKFTDKNGVALVIVVFAMMVFGVLIWTQASMQSSDFEVNLRNLDSERALYLAESGVQWAASRLKQDIGWRTDSNHGYPSGYAQHNITPGQYNVICRDPQGLESGSAVIKSTGYVPIQGQYRGSRIAKLIITLSAGFRYGIFAVSSVSLSGQAETDSYDSNNGSYGLGNIAANGDIATNGEISLSGQAYINGDASTGQSGTFNQQTKVSGTITHNTNLLLNSVTVPGALVSLPSSGSLSLAGTTTATLNPGDYKYSSISLSGQSILTIIGPANIYLTGSSSLSVTGQAQMVISNASTGPVKIYADGGILISGQGVVNQLSYPGSLFLYGTDTNTSNISISGQGNFYGAIYSPGSNISISGQGDIYGLVAGYTITSSGQAEIHYDEALVEFGKTLESDTRTWEEI